MNKPYIIVHMMTSVDGRIDCGMTAQLAGEPEYFYIGQFKCSYKD